MNIFECRAECRAPSSIFKSSIFWTAELNVDFTARYSRCIFSNAELNVEPIARYSKCYGVECRAECWSHSLKFKMNVFKFIAECRTHRSIFSELWFWMQSWMLNLELNIQSVFGVECSAESRSISLILTIDIFECRAEGRTHSSIFKVRIILNAELNVDLTARYSRWMLLNAELNVEPIARNSKCYGFECRAECWTHSSTFKVSIILNAELNVDLIARYSGWIFSNAELNVEPIAPYSNCLLFWMQSSTSISQRDNQDVCFRMQSWMSNP